MFYRKTKTSMTLGVCYYWITKQSMEKVNYIVSIICKYLQTDKVTGVTCELVSMMPGKETFSSAGFVNVIHLRFNQSRSSCKHGSKLKPSHHHRVHKHMIWTATVSRTRYHV